MDIFDFDGEPTAEELTEADTYDLLTFEARDEYDAQRAADAYEAVYGVPARPGTRR